MANIPNLFIIGAPKSGTTALANNLAQHPDVFISQQKEPRFFDAHTFYDYEDDYPIKDIKDYLSLFYSSKSKYNLDASVFNMYSKESIANILSLSPEAKFILLLREPVSASLSMHKQRLSYSDIKMREISDDFMECWNKLEDRKSGKGYPKGCRNKFLFRYDLLYSYELYIPYILEFIKEENLFIGFYDDYLNESSVFYEKLFCFLDINKIGIDNKKLNESKIIKKSKLLSYIDFLAKKSFLLREKIGMTGGKLSSLKKNIINLYKDNNFPKQKANEEVHEFFRKTNEYIMKLRENNHD